MWICQSRELRRRTFTVPLSILVSNDIQSWLSCVFRRVFCAIHCSSQVGSRSDTGCLRISSVHKAPALDQWKKMSKKDVYVFLYDAHIISAITIFDSSNTEIADSNPVRVITEVTFLCITSRCLVTLRWIDPPSKQYYRICTRFTVLVLILSRNRPEDPIPKSWRNRKIIYLGRKL